MRISTTSTASHVVLDLHGELTPTDADPLRSSLARALAVSTQPLVVCDLSDVPQADPLALRVLTIHRDDPSGPGPALCLVGASGEVARALSRLGVSRFVPMADTVQAALAREHCGSPALCVVREFALGATAPRQARRFVRDTAASWGLSASADAELVTTELVTNAVQHAQTDVVVRLERGVGHLLVAVSDWGVDAFPDWWSGVEGSAARMTWGHGLTIVRSLAERTGVRHESTGRKVVWAVLAVDAAGSAGVRQPRRIRLTVNSGRAADDGRWRVWLDLVWRPDRPGRVQMVLGSRPAHPMLPRGTWSLALSTLRDGLRGPTRDGEVRLRPDRAGRSLALELPSSPPQVVRVSASRVEEFVAGLSRPRGSPTATRRR